MEIDPNDITPITMTEAEFEAFLMKQPGVRKGEITIEGRFDSGPPRWEQPCEARPCFMCGGCSTCGELHFVGKACTDAVCPRFLTS